MTILVIAEHNNRTLNRATLNVLAAAKSIGGTIDVLVAGNNCQKVVDETKKIAGVNVVLVAENDVYAHHLPENIGLLISSLGASYSHILSAASTMGKGVMPRVAALLNVEQISEIVEVVSADTFKRPIYAGNAIATVQCKSAITVITVRITGFEPVKAEDGNASVKVLDHQADAKVSRFISEELTQSERPDLTASRVVI